MIKNPKAKGSRNERRSIALLEAAGYACMKAGGSLGAFDVICTGSNDIVMIQCKSNRWTSALEEEAMRLVPAPDNAKRLVHRWDDFARVPRVREL